MKHIILTVGILVLAPIQMLSAQGKVAVEPAVAISAQQAVQKLGDEMIKGNFAYGHQRMYPRWKRRLAKRYPGGMPELERALAASLQQKVRMRLAVVGFQARRPQSFFSVWRTKKWDPVTKKPIKDAAGNEIIVEHWLAVVPTTTRVQIPDPQRGGMLRTIEEDSHTIAISEKGKNEWFFMTGLKPTVQDLRSLFPTLPPNKEELGLPKPAVREIK